MVVSPMSLWGVAWWICMQNVAAWRMFESVHQNAISKCGDLECHNIGTCECGQGQKALEIFRQMQQEDVRPDSVTFVGVLSACASIEALEEGKHAHEQIIESGWDSDVFVGSSLVDMYAKCGSMDDAQRVFIKMPSRDVVTGPP